MAFIFFCIVFFGGMFAYAALGLKFWDVKENKLAKRISIVFTMEAIGWFFELLANAFDYQPWPKHSLAFSVFWWVGRLYMTIPAILLLVWMMKRRKDDKT